MGALQGAPHTGPQVASPETGVSSDCFLGSENDVTLSLKTEISVILDSCSFLSPSTHPSSLSNLSTSLHLHCFFCRSSYCQHTSGLPTSLLTGLPTSPLRHWYTVNYLPNLFSSCGDGDRAVHSDTGFPRTPCSWVGHRPHICQ